MNTFLDRATGGAEAVGSQRPARRCRERRPPSRAFSTVVLTTPVPPRMIDLRRLDRLQRRPWSPRGGSPFAVSISDPQLLAAAPPPERASAKPSPDARTMSWVPTLSLSVPSSLCVLCAQDLVVLRRRCWPRCRSGCHRRSGRRCRAPRAGSSTPSLTAPGAAEDDDGHGVDPVAARSSPRWAGFRSAAPGAAGRGPRPAAGAQGVGKVGAGGDEHGLDRRVDARRGPRTGRRSRSARRPGPGSPRRRSRSGWLPESRK